MRTPSAVATVLAATPVLSWGQVSPQRVEHAAVILEELVEIPGVSGDESGVRAAVRDRLPEWARSTVDSAGNLWVRVGSGDPVVVFVAHLDETGFRVAEILEDGSLALQPRGGFLQRLWEATPALIQAGARTIRGVFTPPEETGGASVPPPQAPFRVDLGTTSRLETEALGVAVGQTVTNPKEFVRLAGTRATARSFDDRVGSTAQLLALETLDRSALQHEVVFLWVTEEETGLLGSRAAATQLRFRPVRVYAVDTFVSADSPLDPQQFAVTPLGRGPVARAVDNSSVTPPAVVDTLRRLANRRGLPLQVGTTNGGNDGSAFQSYGVVDVPIGWPLRYSHSPIEVIDLTDLVVLSDIIKTIAEEW